MQNKLMKVAGVLAYSTLAVVICLVANKYLQAPARKLLHPGEVSWDAYDESPMTPEQLELYGIKAGPSVADVLSQ